MKSYKRINEETQYALFCLIADDIGRSAVAACLYAMHRRGRTKAYIKQLYEDIKLVLEYPKGFGEELTDTFVKDVLKREYDIDLSEVTLKKETFRDFQRRKSNDKD